MRAAIVGFGYMGQMYFDLIKEKEKEKKWELIGVHDIDSKKFKTDKVFKDRLELISNPDVDVVIICTPNKQHLPILNECLKHKKNVILEKPMGSEEAESYEIYKKIQEHKDTSVVLVNITHCFYDKIQEAKAKLKEYDIGSIKFISDRVVFPIRDNERNSWLFQKDSVTHGVMQTNGCHLLARVLHLFSDYKPKFEVIGGVFGNTNRLGDIDDSSAQMRLNLVLSDQRKIPVSIFANWPTAKSTDEAIQESMEILTTKGKLHVQAWNEVKLYSEPKEQISKQVPYNCDSIKGEIEKGVKNVLLAFEEAVAEKKKTVHYSVEYTYQAEEAIAKLYSEFRKNAYQSSLIEALDCIPYNIIISAKVLMN